MNRAGTPFPEHVAEQAVHWLIEMQDAPLTPAQQAAWQQWLQAHGDHRRAWDHIQSVNQRLGKVAAPLAHATLNAPRAPARRRALKALLLLAMAGATGTVLRQQAILPPLTADYRSPVGQRRTVRLGDGSQLQLNTGSAVDIRFDAQQRQVHLLDGEIMLTAANAALPVQVLTRDGRIDLTSGRLNVRQVGNGTRLALFSGAARVVPGQGPARSVQGAGQALLDPLQLSPLTALDANSGAWVDGMLVASHLRLADFLAELGRYRHGHLECDRQVADLKISGSYPVGDTEKVLDLLERSMPVRVRRFTRYWVSVEARA